jgi:purine-binding chemotaxis protein CheW
MSTVHVTVRVNAELYALPVEAVVEVAEVGQLTPVPGTRAGALGLQNLRGTALPVFDLAELLGLSGGDTPRLLVVAEDGARRAGLAVDEVCDVGELPTADEESDSPLLRGAALTDAGLVGVVDLCHLFDELQGVQVS